LRPKGGSPKQQWKKGANCKKKKKKKNPVLKSKGIHLQDVLPRNTHWNDGKKTHKEIISLYNPTADEKKGCKKRGEGW